MNNKYIPCILLTLILISGCKNNEGYIPWWVEEEYDKYNLY
jgi:hypothetical protein